MTRRCLPIKVIAAVGLTIALSASLASAQQPIPTSTYKVVTGQSFVSPDEAAQELQNAINRELRNGCKPISIGAGAGSGAEGVAYTVHGLLECSRFILRRP